MSQEPSAGAGEVLLSISYLPAANRLLVVLIKAKNLHSSQARELLGKGKAGGGRGCRRGGGVQVGAPGEMGTERRKAEQEHSSQFVTV